MKHLITPAIATILFIIVLSLASHQASGGVKNQPVQDEYSAKAYYDVVYISHVREPTRELLVFAKKENALIRDTITRHGYCLPKSEDLKLVYYLYHVGVSFIQKLEGTNFQFTRQYRNFTAHEIIEVGLFYAQANDCK